MTARDKYIQQITKLKSEGFTIVELLVVIVVIGILATISTLVYNGIQGRAATTSKLSTIQNLKKSFSMSKVEHGVPIPNIEYFKAGDKYSIGVANLKNSRVNLQEFKDSLGFELPEGFHYGVVYNRLLAVYGSTSSDDPITYLTTSFPSNANVPDKWRPVDLTQAARTEQVPLPDMYPAWFSQFTKDRIDRGDITLNKGSLTCNLNGSVYPYPDAVDRQGENITGAVNDNNLVANYYQIRYKIVDAGVCGRQNMFIATETGASNNDLKNVFIPVNVPVLAFPD